MTPHDWKSTLGHMSVCAVIACTGAGATPPTTPPAAVKLAFVVQPSAVTAGAAITPALQVAVQDAGGNTVVNATTNVALALTTGTGASDAVLGGSLSRAAVRGVATFDDLTIDRASAEYTLTATATNLASATSASVSVTVGNAATSCATPASGWIWCDDFEVDRLSSYFEVETDGGSLARASAVGRNGSWGMRSRFAVGQVSAGSMKLAFGRTPDAYFRSVDAGTRHYREMYWRFYLRNSATWTGGGGDKLTRLTSFAGANWSQAMIAHVWSGSPGANQNYLALDPASGTDAAGTLRTTTYNDFANMRWLGLARSNTAIFETTRVGQWYCIESHVKLNTAGQSDGVFELWINGQPEASRSGLNWLGTYSAYGLNAVFLESYWNAGSPTAQERYFDDFVVSETRIGC